MDTPYVFGTRVEDKDVQYEKLYDQLISNSSVLPVISTSVFASDLSNVQSFHGLTEDGCSYCVPLRLYYDD